MVFPEYLHFSTSPDRTLIEVTEKLSPDLVAILVDEHTKERCFSNLNIPPVQLIEISSGEKNKTFTTCEKIWEQMTELGMSRKSLLINLGGGVIGDMGGFVASTFKRGIQFINIPTTLLSMVDASIGGKLGIDFQGLKNHIGLFSDPAAVIISPQFLQTLPREELKSGFAEVLKHALIADLDYWETVKQIDLPNANWDEIIKKSIVIKAAVVSNDPYENGKRKILNFGHSFGHAIETHFLETEQPLSHGEAVAVGMVLEAHISFEKKLLPEHKLKEIEEVIRQYFDLPDLPNLEVLLPLIRQDKKNKNNALNFSLLNGIGDCKYDVEVDLHSLTSALHYYKKIR
ncbi:MAG: 3-dehydroquinate synthase [Cytophagales bacterium]|nr:3-dehydroquinate synthase [Cytophagales bacterium]